MSIFFLVIFSDEGYHHYSMNLRLDCARSMKVLHKKIIGEEMIERNHIIVEVLYGPDHIEGFFKGIYFW